MNNDFGMKELYQVTLKTTYPLRLGNKTFEENETVAMFDKLQIANFQEIKSLVEAKGGLGNQGLVTWQTTKEVDFIFNQGVFSKSQFAFFTGANIAARQNGVELTNREILETDENGIIELKYTPLDYLFVYNAAGDKISSNEYTRDGKVLKFNNSRFEDFIFDYNFYYENKVEGLVIGQELIKGFLSLEARTKTKDDITGHVKTGIIQIPKLKLMSDLSMRLGENAAPLVGTFKAVGYPTGAKGNSAVMNILFLEDDIDSDM